MVNTFLGQLELTNFATGWCMSNVEMFSPWFLVGVFAIIYVYSSQMLGRKQRRAETTKVCDCADPRAGGSGRTCQTQPPWAKSVPRAAEEYWMIYFSATHVVGAPNVANGRLCSEDIHF